MATSLNLPAIARSVLPRCLPRGFAEESPVCAFMFTVPYGLLCLSQDACLIYALQQVLSFWRQLSHLARFSQGNLPFSCESHQGIWYECPSPEKSLANPRRRLCSCLRLRLRTP